jgi:hypothetical protein
MFIVNQEGRIVDLPARLEESGYRQAREVLSISSELMNGITSGILMSDMDTLRLRSEILRRFPNVITDEEYLEQHPTNLPTIEPKAPISMTEIKKAKGITQVADKIAEKVVETKEVISPEMTKEKIIGIATQNNVKLSNSEKKFAKAKLISLINERQGR